MAIKALVILAFIYSTPLIQAMSVSQVAENEPSPSISKSVSKIHLPQVPVPEFPKFVSRPGKNPSQSLPMFGSSGSGSQNQYQHNLQQQQQSLVPQQAPPQPLQPLNIPSPVLYSEQDDDMKGEQVEFIVSEMVPEFQDGFAPSSEDYSRPASPAALPDKAQDSSASKPSTGHLPARPASMLVENANAPIHAATSSTADKNDEGKNGNGNPATSDKFQESSTDLSMPVHVMNILSMLGMANGGSLAQASKPEKEGTGHGFTTANAIGYATGDNATVTASVSNKMEVNTQTVILTESATASASSLSNGTAFSQATLNSNGWPSQFDNGWKGIPGSGWAKSTNPSKKGKKLRRRRHEPLLI